jgi:tetratricopeptide (TPR) repeat protein
MGKMQSAGTIQPAAVVGKMERFARLHPENALANYYYAVALWKRMQGRSDPATSAQVQSLLERAVQLDPKLGLAHLQRGIIEADAGNLASAISAYQQAIAASPQFEEPHYRLAQVYRRAGDTAKAQQELRLFEQLSKQAAADAERERREIQQFVVAMRETKPAPTPPTNP